MKFYFVYILASKRNGTLYVGVTDNLKRRVWEHRNEIIKGFTKEYGVHMLIYYEQYNDINEAIIREKRIKKWKRHWKIKLINTMNCSWIDLYDSI